MLHNPTSNVKKLSNQNVEKSVNNNVEDDHRLTVLAGREDAILTGNVTKAHGSDINDAVFVNDHDLVTCSSDKTAKLWTNMHEKPTNNGTIIDQRWVNRNINVDKSFKRPKQQQT